MTLRARHLCRSGTVFLPRGHFHTHRPNRQGFGPLPSWRAAPALLLLSSL